MNVTCSAEPCPVILNATCVFYEGNTLVYTGIVTNDNLQTALQKIDQKFQDADLGYIFTNGIEQLSPGQPVMLGGALIKNTTIGGLYNLAFAGTLEASALITTGGTSTDFVKGDGSLDPTSYQPSGNYITNLTGDVLANGPGSVTATLATVFGSPGTYGNSGNVPAITVDGKGRITNVTPIPINYPAQSLSFVGDVDGFGFTGSPVTLTLDTVNTDVYGSNNFLKFAVNGKGLITSATPVSGGDITTALGYVPVDNAIELTINGVAHDLTASRNWDVGTVTSVSITAGTGINASISNPNSTPSISIINTAPDQTVVLNGGFGISVTGSYPNFTVTNDYPSLGGTVTSFSAGNLSPLFTTSVASSTTTPALSFALANAAANTVLAGPNGATGAPTYRALVAADIPSLSYISNISATAPLATTGGLTPTLSISQADASTNGYLSSADWNTFSSKQPAGNYITDITGDATASGPGSACLTFATVNATAGTFGSSTQVPVITVNGKGLVTCVTTSNISGSLEFIGDVTGIGSTGTCTSLTLATVNNDVYTSETLLNIAVNGKGLITSANPTTAGDICSTLGYTPEDVANKSTCTSLGSSNTLYPTQLAVKTYVDSATAGGIILQGDWNAATNTPDITGTTTTGFAWRVSVDGTTNLGGINDWQVGDLAVKSATGWVKIDNSDGVTSVFGRFGAVVATTGDYLTCQVTECGNLYYTDARVRAAVGHTAPLTYCSTTGVFGISQSNTTTDGYLSATDWTTFNDKQPALGYTPVNQTRQLTINGTTHDLSADRTWNVGTVTSVTGSAPLASSGGATPNLTISQAGAASDGFLSSTDWNTFNSKTSCLGTVTNVAACTSTTGVSITGSPITSSGTLGINVSTASTVCTGLLTAADWNTFNNKTSCTGTVTSVGLTSSTTGVTIGSSPITSSGNITLDIATASATCTGLLTSADWNTFNSHTSCTGTVTCVNATGTNISVTGGPITTSGTLAISLSGANVCSALGYTPYNATNPNGYTSCVGTVTSAGIVATNINVCNSPVTTSGNICLNLTGANVCSALGYSPVSPSTLSGYVPYTGATTSVNLGANNITAQNYLSDGNGSTTGGYLGFKQYSSTFNGQQGYTSIYALSQSSLYIRYSQLDLSSRTVDLSAALLGTTGRQYLFPDKNGTFAMTNDIPANPVGGTGTTNYLPKFTGTSTIGNSAITDVSGIIKIGTTASTTYGTLTIVQQSVAAPSFVRGIQLVHPNGTGVTGGYLGISVSGQKQGQIQVGDDSNVGDLIINPAGGNLGLGVTPSAWGGNARVFEGANGSALSFNVAAPETALMSNAFYNGSSWIYKTSSQAARYSVNGYNGSHTWEVAPSGTAGNAISFTQAMTLNASGNLGLGTTSPNSYLGGASGLSVYNASLPAVGLANTSKSWMTYLAGSTYRIYNITDAVIGLDIASTGAATFSSSVTSTFTYNGGGTGMLHLTSNGTEGGSITFEKTSGTAQKYKAGNSGTAFFIYNETAGNQPFTILNGGNVGINTTNPLAGLQVEKYGSKFDSDVQYNQPSGNVFLSVAGAVANQDNWFGIRGSYNSSTGSSNLLLQANYRDIGSQAGHYISSKGQSLGVADFIIGKLVTTTSVSTPPILVPQLTIASSGVATFSVPRANGTNATSIILSDNLTGISTPGFGVRIFGYSNGGGVQSAIGFENGGTGTNNESQLSFYTQNVAGGLSQRLLIASTGAATFSSSVTVNGVVSIPNTSYFVSGTQGFRFNNSTDTFNNFIVYDNGNTYTRGNVGIGTTSPGNRLAILGPDESSNPTLGTNAGKFGIFNGVGAGTYGMIMGVINNGNSYLQVQRIDGTATAYNLLLQPSGGNVGIGIKTANPSRLLSIESSDTWMSFKVTGDKEYLIGQGTSTAFRILDASAGVERMRITTDGDVGIGNIGFASTRLTVTGKSTTSSDFAFVANNSANSNLFLVRNDGVITVNGSITASGDITAFSDARVKTNVKTIENALDKVLALRGVSYNRTDSDDKETKIGVIAQETLPVVPELVNQNDNGMYSVSYGNLGALFIEAFKEQQKQIDEIKKQVV